MRCREKTYRGSERGAAFVELAIALPLLLTLVAGTMNYGYMILQVQVMSEAVRHSARTAAAESNDGHTCAELSTIAQSAFTSYVTSHMSNTGGLKGNWWNSPNVCLKTRTWDAGLSDQFINVSVTSGGDQHCTFCYDRMWSQDPITVESSFKLEWDCQGNGLPAC